MHCNHTPFIILHSFELLLVIPNQKFYPKSIIFIIDCRSFRAKPDCVNFHHFNEIMSENYESCVFCRSVFTKILSEIQILSVNFHFHRWKFTPSSKWRKLFRGVVKVDIGVYETQCVFDFDKIRGDNLPCTTWRARDGHVLGCYICRRVKFYQNTLRFRRRWKLRDKGRTTLANQRRGIWRAASSSKHLLEVFKSF